MRRRRRGPSAGALRRAALLAAPSALRRAALLAATLAAASGLAPAPPARAAEIAASLGANDLRKNPTPAAAVEIRSRPVLSWGWGEARLGAAIEANGGFWGGGGPIVFVPFGRDWRAEASVMIGGYDEGTGVDLGAEFPMFRTQIGLSRAIAPGWRLGASINHKSNAGTSPINPGVETVLFTLVHSF